jgi:5-methylcytosine-specific restriction protein A
MPKAMKQWCKAAGCSGEAVERGYCKACAGKRPQSGDAYRGSRHERGYGSRWEKLRMSVLRLSPGCVVCGQPATDVDHIIPKRRGGSDDRSNLQTLCHACHSRKTASERNGVS